MKVQLSGFATILNSKKLSDETKAEILSARENGDVPYITVTILDSEGNEVKINAAVHLSKSGGLTSRFAAKVTGGLTYGPAKEKREKEEKTDKVADLASELLSS